MTKHVRHSDGIVHDVPDDHPAVAQAEQHQGGWRFASHSEIVAMYKAQGVELPEEFRHSPEESQAETASSSSAATVTVVDEPEEADSDEEEGEAAPGVPPRATPLPSQRSKTARK
jgi:hypothetical protein